MIIYKTIFPNGKIYIGQDKNNNENYFGSGVKCKCAIKSFGKSKLKKEILRYCNSQKELDKWEQVFILKFDSTNPNIGYNILPGTSNKFGCGSPMLIKEVAEKSSKSQKLRFEKNPKLRKIISIKQKRKMKDFSLREKISKSLKGRFEGDKNPNFENFWNDEQKQKLRQKMIGRYDGDKNPNFGNKWSDEKRNEFSKSLIGKYSKEKNPMFGKKRITNGKVNLNINKNEPLPEGFWFGLTRGLK